jgi:hypothetical protein
MIRHCVVVTVSPDTSDADRDGIVEALRGLPAQIPEIRSYEVGADLGLRDGNADIAIVASFDDEAGWRAYLSHPAHLQVIDQHFAPHSTGRTSVQFEV